jgi:dihydrofolate reductase
MSERFLIDAYAIVSSDGMIADENCLMPNSLKFEADQRLFEQALDGVDVVVHGRKSHEGQPNSHRRRRLLMTRAIEDLKPDESAPNVVFWNPAGATLEAACAALGVNAGVVAIIGGTSAYDMFLHCYRMFHLVRAGRVTLPGGTPVFSQVGPDLTPEDVLRRNGLEPEPPRLLDAEHDLIHCVWKRRALTD